MEGAVLDGADRGVKFGVAGDHDHVGLRQAGLHPAQDLHAVEAGQDYIKKDEIEGTPFKFPEKFLPRGVGRHQVPFFFQGPFQPLLDDDFVIHYGDRH